MEQSILRTPRLELVDDRGNVRIKIGLFEEGPAIRFYDENGHGRIWLGMSFLNQPQLILYDTITTRVRLGLDGEGEPTLAMLDCMTANAAKPLLDKWEREAQRPERQPQRATGKRPTQTNGKED